MPSCSHWLKSRKTEDFGLRFLAMKMREHNFMGKQRRPFKSCGSVLVSSANQFVLSIGKFDEFGLTELLDQFGAIA